MVSILGQLLFRKFDRLCWEFWVIKHFSQRPPIRYRRKLFIALSLQSMTLRRHSQLRLLPSGRRCVSCGDENHHRPTKTDFLFIRISNLVCLWVVLFVLSSFAVFFILYCTVLYAAFLCVINTVKRCISSNRSPRLVYIRTMPSDPRLLLETRLLLEPSSSPASNFNFKV